MTRLLEVNDSVWNDSKKKSLGSEKNQDFLL